MKPSDEPIEGLNDDERALLVKGLCALRYHRGRDWRRACHFAAEAGRPEPPLDTDGIEQIKRLARRLGGKARHWTEWTEEL